MPLLSPGVELKENTTQSTVVQNATGRAAMAGKFQWGPAFQVIQVTNEVELVEMFGQPDAQTADYFLSAANFLAYGNDLRLVRVVNEESAKTTTKKKLYRDQANGMVAGIASGLNEYLSIDIVFVRILMLIFIPLTFVTST